MNNTNDDGHHRYPGATGTTFQIWMPGGEFSTTPWLTPNARQMPLEAMLDQLSQLRCFFFFEEGGLQA